MHIGKNREALLAITEFTSAKNLVQEISEAKVIRHNTEANEKQVSVISKTKAN
jgi:hypothetical protein